MCSPLIFTDYQFNDYLIYILHNKFIFINKFPTMQFLGYIICSNKNIHLTNICFSNNMKYIYAYDEFNKSIYIVQQKNNKNGHWYDINIFWNKKYNCLINKVLCY